MACVRRCVLSRRKRLCCAVADEDVALALDAASTEFFKKGKYELAGEGKTLDSEAFARYLADLAGR